MAEENNFGGYADAIKGAVYSGDNERSRYDKLLSKSEGDRLREIMKKEILTNPDIDEVMNIAVSTEIKLTRFNDWEKYVLGKYLIWVGEYAKRFSKALRAKEYYTTIWSELTDRTKNLRHEIEKDYSTQFKQLIHSYFFLARSPLSIEGSMVDALTTDRKDYQYTPLQQMQPAAPTQGWGKT